jgi:hypothetical protein
MSPTLRRELIIAGVLAAIGLIALPLAIYFVGQRIVGPYGGEGTEGGSLDLSASIWAAMAGGDWAAWLLVLSPYVFVQLIRLSMRIARPRHRVTTVTD